MTDIGSLATEPLFGLPLADLWFVLLFFIFGMFLFLDGFDFGVGVLFATRTDDREKEQLLAAIGPFWDGNEVWLVVFGGVLFAAFPVVYANLFSRYYLLTFALLAALGLRGLAPEMYEERTDDRWRWVWGYVFVVGSTTSPFLLGLFVMHWLIGASSLVTGPGILGGLAVLTLTVVDGAAFLGVKTRGALRDNARTYGIWAAMGYLGVLILVLGATYVTEPSLRGSLRSLPVVILVFLSSVMTASYVGAAIRQRYYLMFVAAGCLVFGFVTLVALLMYPLIDPVVGLTVREAIVSVLPLNLMSTMFSVLLPLVLLYFITLYSAFSGPIEPQESNP